MKNLYKKTPLTFVSFLITALISHNIFAGTIKGFVLDSKTKEPLIGAVVIIKGTSFATSVTLDGSYYFSKIDPGTYTLECSYLSYETASSTGTVTKMDETLTINFDLKEKSTELTEVVVQGEIDKESDLHARKSEQNADNVLNIISAKTIQLLPDVTVGNVLQRVSGVSLVRNASGDGQYAIIRGMDQRYNYTLVNGIKIPSPDNKNRYVPMDIFPADLIERLEVVKALTPNMEGDAVGGAMNMIMKSAPKQLSINGTAAIGYSSIYATRPFSAYDNSNTQWQSPREIHGNNYVSQVTDFKPNHAMFHEIKNPLNSMFNFSIGNSVLKDKRLGFIIGASYQRTYRGTNSTYYNQNTQPLPDPAPNTPVFLGFQNRKYDILQSRLGTQAKIDYAFNNLHKLSLYGIFMQLDEDLHRNLVENQATAGGYYSENDRSRKIRQQVFNLTFKGDHQLLQTLKTDYSLVYSNANSNTPDWTELSLTHYIGPDNYGNTNATYITPLSHTWTHNYDEDKAGYLNFEFTPTKYFDFFKNILNVDISAGGLYRAKTRSNYYSQAVLNTTLPNTTPQVFTSVDNTYYSFNPASAANPDTANPNNYSAQENIGAYYFMAKILLMNKLQILGGVRNEYTEQGYQSQLDRSLVGRDGKIKYSDILPSVHLKYMINPKQNLRASYYSAITRPGYVDFVPATLPDDNFNITGNYLIKHSTADNYDLRYEFFPNASDQFLLGGFYKTIVNPIEYGFNQVGNNNYDIKPQNFGTATNFGIEAVVTKYIRNWGINANYTYTHSTISQAKGVYGRDSKGNIVNSTEIQVRPLQGQSDHIANVSLLYKNPTIGLDVQLTWVYTGKRINILSPYKDLDWWQRPFYQFDFSAEKKFYKHFSVFFKATNLLNTPMIVEIQHANTVRNAPEQDSDNSIVVQKDVFQQTFLLGLRFKLQ